MWHSPYIQVKFEFECVVESYPLRMYFAPMISLRLRSNYNMNTSSTIIIQQWILSTWRRGHLLIFILTDWIYVSSVTNTYRHNYKPKTGSQSVNMTNFRSKRHCMPLKSKTQYFQNLDNCSLHFAFCKPSVVSIDEVGLFHPRYHQITCSQHHIYLFCTCS